MQVSFVLSVCGVGASVRTMPMVPPSPRSGGARLARELGPRCLVPGVPWAMVSLVMVSSGALALRERTGFVYDAMESLD